MVGSALVIDRVPQEAFASRARRTKWILPRGAHLDVSHSQTGPPLDIAEEKPPPRFGDANDKSSRSRFIIGFESLDFP